MLQFLPLKFPTIRSDLISPSCGDMVYSQLLRKTSIGLTPDARRAGMKPEIAATSSNASAIPRYVGRSQDEVANSSEEISLATASATNVPRTIPASARRSVPASTWRCTWPTLAPSAIRMPIACACCVTE